MGKDFILAVAGEESGDILGERPVREAVASGFRVAGAGGRRMREAGLEAAASFEDMAVNGFWDVIRRFPKLFSIKKKLAGLLRRDDCKALLCIDYPGMNLPLLKLAKRLGKPVFYIAPPKIWAWKRYRGRHFKGVDVWVFFDFEKRAYEEFGANARIVKHPCFLNAAVCEEFRGKVLFLPGSRVSQVKRNLPKYIKLAKARGNAMFVAPRKEVLELLEKRLKGEFPAMLKPCGASFAGAEAAVCMIGTAALETWAAGVPTVAVAVTDPITYFIGKLLLRTKYLALPNIIAGREVVPEHVFMLF